MPEYKLSFRCFDDDDPADYEPVHEAIIPALMSGDVATVLPGFRKGYMIVRVDGHPCHCVGVMHGHNHYCLCLLNTQLCYEEDYK